MTTFAFIMSSLGCMLGPGVQQYRGPCQWLDVTTDGFTDLRDIAAIQRDAGCIIATCTIRPEALIDGGCP